jgi:hypothetical protein
MKRVLPRQGGVGRVATLLDDSLRGSCCEREYAVSDKPAVGVSPKALPDRSWSKVNRSDTWCSKRDGDIG